MRAAFEINIAVWSMLACALLGLAQYFDFLFKSSSHHRDRTLIGSFRP